MDMTKEILMGCIGALIVLWMFYSRFHEVPGKLGDAAKEGGLSSGLMAKFGIGERESSEILRPPRANTTAFKFRLYQTTYALIGLATYLAIVMLPELLQDIKAVSIALKGDVQIPENIGPVGLAIVVVWVLPRFMFFKAWDESIRYFLYEKAAIPAQQLRERNRLKKANFQVDPEALARVRVYLVEEGFAVEDIAYNAECPATQSLWTKASLLMESISQWEARNKFKTAFAILKEREGNALSVQVVRDIYEALMGDAKTCFEALRNAPNAPETEARDAEFRKNCKLLLKQIYDLLSRVSLHSHFSDRDRVRDMNQLGFALRLDTHGPIPGPNDLLFLGMILAGLLVWPLAWFIPLVKAIMIGAAMFISVLLPFLLMHNFPDFAEKSESDAPDLLFQTVSAVAAMALVSVIFIGFNSFRVSDNASASQQTVQQAKHAAPSAGVADSKQPPVSLFDLTRGWNHFAQRSYPWVFLFGMVAGMIAWSMKYKNYPNQVELSRMTRYRLWGSWRDSLMFGVVALLLMIFLVIPLLPLKAEVAGGREQVLQELSYFDRVTLVANRVPEYQALREKAMRPMLLPLAVTMMIGFLVPTWYRAQLRHKFYDRRKSSPEQRAKFEEKLKALHGYDHRQQPAG